jgi:hypothetical protein
MEKKMPVDRPRPVMHEYRGVNLLIDIRYSEEDDFPRLAVITAEDNPGRAAVIELNVSSHEEAVAIGIEEAESWIDLR